MEEKKPTTAEQLQAKAKQADELLKWINNIVENLKNGELTLSDIIAEEESLDNRCYELQECCKKIISLRQWLDFENIDSQRDIF